MQDNLNSSSWSRWVLKCAALYNIAWGTLVVLLPEETLRLAGFQTPVDHPALWQCIGMIVGVYGVGYWIASGDPQRHWPIVFVGLLGKILGPVGFATGVLTGDLPGQMGWTILLNDLIWWLPFGALLWSTLRSHLITTSGYAFDTFDDDPVRELRTQFGDSLFELSDKSPQLVVFLRHAGCTFCREALADLGQQRSEIESKGAQIVLVHLGDKNAVADLLTRNNLIDLPRIYDPDCRLYQQFGLELGNFSELFGWRVVLRGLKAAIVDRHGIGAVSGNALQMPGAFVVHKGKFLKGFQYTSASDRPDYVRFVYESLCDSDQITKKADVSPTVVEC